MVDNKVLLAVLDKFVEEAVTKKWEQSIGPRGPRGLKGRDGNEFNFEDHIESIKNLILDNLPKSFELTDDQIALLKGEAGRPGRDGIDFNIEAHGEAVKEFVLQHIPNKIDLTDEQKDELRGRNGRDGRDGKDFSLEDNGESVKEFVLQHVPKKIELTDEQRDELRGRDGKDGRDGRDFVLEDHLEEIKKLIPEKIELTDEQREELRGPSGQDGKDGLDGRQGLRGKDGRDFDFEEHRNEIETIIKNVSLKFEDLTDEQKNCLRGKDGKDGKDFVFEDSREGINDLLVAYFTDVKDSLKLKFSDLTEDEKAELKGPRGQRGKPGHDFDFKENEPAISDIIKNHVKDISPELKLKMSDLTDEEVESLRGPQGLRGKDGRDFSLEENLPTISEEIKTHINEISPSLKMKFDDLTDVEKDSLKLKFEHLSDDDRTSLRGPRGQRGKVGMQGEQGERGENGKDGEKGSPGVRGARGPIGPMGLSGRDGRDGADGVDGKDAPRLTKVEVDQNKEDFNLVFKYDDGSKVKSEDIKLPKGDTIYYSPIAAGGGNGGGTGGGSPIDVLEAGVPVVTGVEKINFQGTSVNVVVDPVDPKQVNVTISGTGGGDSAYQVALNNGFVGTEADWLASLVGPTGPAGADGTDGADGATGATGATGPQGPIGPQGSAGTNGTNGTDGADGADGISAYQVAINNGFVGTEADWLLSLHGADGADGADGATGPQGPVGPYGSEVLEDGSYTIELKPKTLELYLEDETDGTIWGLETTDDDGIILHEVDPSTPVSEPFRIWTDELQLRSLSIESGQIKIIDPITDAEIVDYLAIEGSTRAFKVGIKEDVDGREVLYLRDTLENYWQITDQLGAAIFRIDNTVEGAVFKAKAYTTSSDLQAQTPTPGQAQFTFVVEDDGTTSMRVWDQATSQWRVVGFEKTEPEPKDSYPLGTVITSFLTPEEFLNEPEINDPFGDRWRLLDGSDVEGSDLGTLRGWRNLPQGKGVFIRGHDDGFGVDVERESRIKLGNDYLGSYQDDAFMDHKHRWAMGYSYDRAGSSQIISTSNTANGSTTYDPWGGFSAMWTVPAVNGDILKMSDYETRSKNIAANRFVKYNR